MIHELNPAVSAAGTAPCILLLRRPPPSSLLGALARFPIPCCRAQTGCIWHSRRVHGCGHLQVLVGNNHHRTPFWGEDIQVRVSAAKTFRQ